MKLLRVQQAKPPAWAYIQATPEELAPVLAQPSRGPSYEHETSLFTFAKLYWGWYMINPETEEYAECWEISGYGGDDVVRVLDKLDLEY